MTTHNLSKFITAFSQRFNVPCTLPESPDHDRLVTIAHQIIESTECKCGNLDCPTVVARTFILDWFKTELPDDFHRVGKKYLEQTSRFGITSAPDEYLTAQHLSMAVVGTLLLTNSIEDENTQIEDAVFKSMLLLALKHLSGR